MKSIVTATLACILLVCLLACSPSYAPVSLNAPLPLPDDGIISQELLTQIQAENAIATFTGQSNGMEYEWKVFGSQLTKVRDVNLSLTLEKKDGGIQLQFAEGEAFGFSAYLSVYPHEKWDALDATAYRDREAVASVTLTGNKETILNLSVSEPMGTILILPNGQETAETQATTELPPEVPPYETQPGEPSETEAEAPDQTVVETDTQQSDQAPPTAESEFTTTPDTPPASDEGTTGQDKYLTDPIPEGKPLPVEPENQEIDKGKTYTCTISIECSTILNNLSELDPDKPELVPSDGVILPPTTVTFCEGESVFDVIKRVCKEYGIHLEFSWTPVYNSAYIEGIHNLYEFDCGALSGWMYRVNGWYPNYGCSRYQLADRDVIEWRYTCNDLGKDIGCDWME